VEDFPGNKGVYGSKPDGRIDEKGSVAAFRMPLLKSSGVPGMDGRFESPFGIFVVDVVVDKRVIMEKFERQRRADDILRIFPRKAFVEGEREDASEFFSSSEAIVRDRIEMFTGIGASFRVPSGGFFRKKCRHFDFYAFFGMGKEFFDGHAFLE
jgi:hypothetical protein